MCSPVIEAEMHEWVAIGGSNSGCCGNSAHTYGFHREASAVPASDYSRRRDPAGPNGAVNWSYACAGDFSHRGVPALRARHATLLARLMANEPSLAMVCEFIGQPWADRPVYYWARWNGVTTLNKYTGAGHDMWSHVSWYRSRANQRAGLWTVAPAPEKLTHPAYPGYVIRYDPDRFDANLRVWQTQMKLVRKWTLTADGIYGPETRRVVLAFQDEKRLGVDGEIGPITWNAAWTAPVT